MIKRHRTVLAGALALAAAGGVAVLASRTAADGAVDEASVARIALADFKKDFEAGKVVLLDVRGAEAYASSHIPGALNFPVSALEQRATELSALKKPIVTYCA